MTEPGTPAEWLAARPIFVTGATGFIGANLVRALLDVDAEVHALVRRSSDPARIRDVLDRLTIHHGDVRREEQVARALRDAEPGAVFHLAMPGPHARTRAARRAAFSTGVRGTVNVLEAAMDADVEAVVHAGGSLEYGPHDRPLVETMRLVPVTMKGAAKAGACVAATTYARALTVPAVVLRIFSVYGPWEAEDRLIPTAIRAALDGDPLPLTESGLCRDLIHVDDVVAALLAAAPQAADQAGRVFNVGTGRQWSNEEVVDLIEDVTGTRIDRRVGAYHPSPSDTHHWVADTTRTREVLGWTARLSLRSGLARTVEWMLRRRDA